MSQELNVNQPYNPSKKYKWAPTDEFVISGSDFGLILNSLRSILATQEAARIILANDAHDAIEKILANSVASGVVKEIEENVHKNSL